MPDDTGLAAGSRLSEESRRELYEHLAKLMVTPKPVSAPVPKLAPARARRVAPRKKPEPSLTEYIREKYEDDQVLQSFADIIDKNPGVWRLMGQLYNLDIKAGGGLRGWEVRKRVEVRDPMVTTIEVDIIDIEGTKVVRSS